MLLQELRQAWRTARTHRGFTALVVLTLGLAIAANGVMFSIIDRLLLSPPPHVHDAGRVTRLYFTLANPGPDGTLTRGTGSMSDYAAFRVMHDGVPAFDHVAAYAVEELSFGHGADAHPIPAQLATAELFATLGARPAVGRFFTADEDRPGHPAQVAVLSDGLWRSAFARDPKIVGRTVTIEGLPFTVIGIAPPGFTGADLSAVDAWVPMSALAATVVTPDWDTGDSGFWLQVIAHLRPGATFARAAAEASVAFRRSAAPGQRRVDTPIGVLTGPLNPARGPGAVVRDRRSAVIPVSLWLAAVSLAVLLIACANIASLLLARTMQRQREIAVRLALGIGRRRLAVHLLAESVLLAAMAGAAALVLADLGARVVRVTLIPDVAWSGSPIDARVFAITAALTIFTGFATGLLPALRAGRGDVAHALKGASRDGGGRRSTARATLLIVQSALSLVLLVGAGLFVQSLRNVQSIDLGMDASRLVLVDGSFFGGRSLSDARRDALLRAARARLEHMPGVTAASLGNGTPFGAIRGGGLVIPGRDMNALYRAVPMSPFRSDVSTDFLRTVGATIVRGRNFAAADAGRPVLIVDENLARAYWPGQNPVGRCARVDGAAACSTIVGVVHGIHQFGVVEQQPLMHFYTPLPAAVMDSAGAAATALVVRTAGDPAAMTTPIHHLLASIAPELAYLAVEPVDARIAPQLHPWKLGATMFGVFGLLALLIASAGLYCVLAYVVTQRTHEIGVRMALGAGRARIVRTVVRSTAGTVLVGVAAGVGVSLIAGKAMASVLYGISPRDPATLAAGAVAFAAIAVVAGAIPAWRAARVAPADALRDVG